MLWFIGLGISGISELSDSTLNVIKDAKIVYLESFTSPISETEKKQLEEIANTKMPDLTAADLEAAIRSIAGTARSMGVETEGVKDV